MMPKTSRRRRWTTDELQKLDELLSGGKEAAEIAAKLNRSRLAIYAKLQQRNQRRARLLSILPRSD